MKIGIVARQDDTGLGNQTRELVKMLNPEKLLIINSSPFHSGHIQHPEWYSHINNITTPGVPQKHSVMTFLRGLDIVISCETFYHTNFVEIARRMNVKTVLQYNFEFLDYLINERKALPDALIAPSMWRIQEVEEKFAEKSIIRFLPPPSSPEIFNNNKINNLKEHKKLLHIGGKAAIHDRNGTETVIEMLKYSKADYELVIKSQTELKISSTDERLTVKTDNEENHADLYDGFDAMVLPRRYAGLCLPMNEALLSGMPVFMSNVSPNFLCLPQKWLAKSEKSGEFMARTMIDIYNTDPKSLAKIIDNYFNSDMKQEKEEAFEIGYSKFSSDILRQKYIDLFNEVLI